MVEGMTFTIPCIFAFPRFDDTLVPVAAEGEINIWI